MLAESEGEVAIGILAMDVELVGLGPLVGIVVRRAEVEQDRRAARNGDVAQHRVACDTPADLHQWLLEPQQLFDRTLDQRAIGAQLLELIGVREQHVEQHAERSVGGAGPAEQQEFQEAVDLVIGQRVALEPTALFDLLVGEGRLDEDRDEIAVGFPPALVAERSHVVRHRLRGARPVLGRLRHRRHDDGPFDEPVEITFGQDPRPSR